MNLYFLCLVASVAGSVATLGDGSVAGSFIGSAARSGVGWCVRILSKLFIGNNKLLKIFSLALNNNRNLFRKDFFSSVFVTFFRILLIH